MNRDKSKHLSLIQGRSSTPHRSCVVWQQKYLMEINSIKKVTFHCKTKCETTQCLQNVQINIYVLVFLTLCPVQIKPACQYQKLAFEMREIIHINAVDLNELVRHGIFRFPQYIQRLKQLKCFVKYLLLTLSVSLAERSVVSLVSSLGTALLLLN